MAKIRLQQLPDGMSADIIRQIAENKFQRPTSTISGGLLKIAKNGQSTGTITTRLSRENAQPFTQDGVTVLVVDDLQEKPVSAKSGFFSRFKKPITPDVDEASEKEAIAEADINPDFAELLRGVNGSFSGSRFLYGLRDRLDQMTVDIRNIRENDDWANFADQLDTLKDGLTETANQDLSTLSGSRGANVVLQQTKSLEIATADIYNQASAEISKMTAEPETNPANIENTTRRIQYLHTVAVISLNLLAIAIELAYIFGQGKLTKQDVEDDFVHISMKDAQLNDQMEAFFSDIEERFHITLRTNKARQSTSQSFLTGKGDQPDIQDTVEYAVHVITESDKLANVPAIIEDIRWNQPYTAELEKILAEMENTITVWIDNGEIYFVNDGLN